MNYHRPLSRLMLTLLTCVSALKASVIVTPANLSTMLASFTQPINLAGLLDKSFGTNGIVTTDVTPHGDSYANAAVLQPDGKIIAVGQGFNGVHFIFALTRYNSDGSLDMSFGTNGIVTTDVTLGQDNGAYAALLQPDGKIVALGWGDIGGNNRFALTRYNSDGSLDESFGGNGIVTTDVTPGNNSQAYAAVLQSDGKIVAVGWGDNGANVLFALTRYNSDGSLDESFGRNGIVTTDVTPYGDYALAAVLQPDGKIIAVGQGFNGVHFIFALTRYNSDGSLDMSFGTNGIVTTDVTLGQDNGAYAALLQPDGKIVALGWGFDGHYVFALVRYNSDGSPDQSFGTNGTGIVTKDVTPVGNNYASAALLQPDGKIVAVGAGSDGHFFFALTRYNSDGSLDQSFGTNGTLTTDVTPGQNSYANAAVLQSDSKIVAVGQGNNGGNNLFALVRYDNPFTLATFTASYGGAGLL